VPYGLGVWFEAADDDVVVQDVEGEAGDEGVAQSSRDEALGG
jgi:hypothetical protein